MVQHFRQEITHMCCKNGPFVLYRCDHKPLAETILHSNGAVYTSRIDLTLYLLYEVRGGFFLLLDPPAKIQLKHVVLGSNIFDLALKTRCPQNGGGGLMLLLVCSQWGGPNQC